MSVLLYLDPSNRRLLNLVPEDAPAHLPMAPVEVADADAERLRAAWQDAGRQGLWLIVAPDLTTTTQAPDPTPFDQAVALLRDYLQSADVDAFLAASPPTTAQAVAALKDTAGALRVLIRVVRGLVQQA